MTYPNKVSGPDFVELVKQLDDSQAHEILKGRRMGVEKESLRSNEDGTLALTPHPDSLGKPLTHPSITTDFSESLLEMVTPPLAGVEDTIKYLRTLHAYVHERIQPELIWSSSMPCILGNPDAIPIAEYGTSNIGQMKHIYRQGLSLRYGRRMQAIAGVHFNYSFDSRLFALLQELDGVTGANYASEKQMGMLRNLYRYGWLTLYLFGASPAVLKEFVGPHVAQLQSFDESTLIGPWATSLRMGRIGYHNNKSDKIGFVANINNLENYISSLRQAVTTPCPVYAAKGIKVNGKYQQLNGNQLQIENEYYAAARPKQPVEREEMQLTGLHQRGIAYVELRLLDLDVFSDIGVQADELHFLELLMAWCLLQPSPAMSEAEMRYIDGNFLLTAHEGRHPDTCLQRLDAEPILLRQEAKRILTEMAPLADLFERRLEPGYVQALAKQLGKVEDVSQTPSARFLDLLQSDGKGFVPTVLSLAEKYADSVSKYHNPSIEEELRQAGIESVAEQSELEAAKKETLDQFIQRYFAQLNP